MTDSTNNPPPVITSIPSDADNEDSSETESEANSRPDGSAAPNEDENAVSTVSTELSDAPTLELLGISRPTSPNATKKYLPPLGLNRPWGLSDYDDYE
jgi:hypothetical protein